MNTSIPTAHSETPTTSKSPASNLSQCGAGSPSATVWALAYCMALVLSVAIPQSLSAQIAQQWDKVLGGTGNDALNDLQLTSDGGFIAAGFSDSPVGSGKIAAYGSFDYWVVKLDAGANVQWERTFGGDNFDYVYTALPLRDGGYLLAGYSASGATGNKTLPSFGGTDIWLIRLGVNGNRLWERVYGGSANDEFGGKSAVIETSDDGFLIAGNSRSPANTGNKTSPLHSIGSDVWVLKLDSNGLKEWEQTYFDGGTVGGGTFVHEAADAYFVAGFTGVADFTAWSGRVDKVTGALLAENNYGSAVVLETGLPLSDGGYWLAGWTYVANSSFWLRRVDALGNSVISRTIGGGDLDRAHSLAAFSGGGYLAGGESSSPPGGDRTAEAYGGDDYWIVKFDDQGGIIWDQAFGGTGDEHLSKVLPTPDGGILLAGHSNSDALPAGGKSVGSLGGNDWWIIKLGLPCDANTPPAIVEISIPPNSQSPECRPSYDQVWHVAAPPYPFDVNSGIGVIVNPVIVGGNNNHDFSIHQDDFTPYDSPYVPHRDSSTVTYRFDQPAIVSGVEIVQHVFGITRVEGFSGNSLNAMTTLGAIFGPSGDVIDAFVVPGEAQSQVFTFNNTSTAGTYFQLVVLKTANVGAFANYRIFPLDQHGNRIPTANSSGPCSVDTTPPTAIAGLDQNIRAGDTVLLDGSASFDDNTASTALVYSWSFSSRPIGSTAILSGAATATPSFVADVTGTYDVQLVVTDEAGLSSTPDHVICSSANLAPTAVAAVDFSLVIIGETAHLNGSASTDPELDSLSFSWTITTKPLGSTATLVNAATATPTLTPDLEGVYQVSLVVSDFIGPGAPATVQITATTAAGFAELQIVNASGIISGLNSGQVTTQGNQTALLNFLSQAMVALQEGDVATAIDKLQKSIARTDGCVLRGSPDGSGAGRDWITDCAAQTQVYSFLNAALDALTP